MKRMTIEVIRIAISCDEGAGYQQYICWNWIASTVY